MHQKSTLLTEKVLTEILDTLLIFVPDWYDKPC